jgi:hypothetical protein
MAAVIQALMPTPTRCTSGVLAPNKSAANNAKNAPRAAGNFFMARFGVGIAILQSLVILGRHI